MIKLLKKIFFHYTKPMTASTQISTPVSQSIDDRIVEMQQQIKQLESEVAHMTTLTTYLSAANVELSRDMQVIYTALEQVAAAMMDPDDIAPGFPFNDDPDDGLLN